jgi:hypothetical protein
VESVLAVWQAATDSISVLRTTFDVRNVASAPFPRPFRDYRPASRSRSGLFLSNLQYGSAATRNSSSAARCSDPLFDLAEQLVNEAADIATATRNTAIADFSVLLAAWRGDREKTSQLRAAVIPDATARGEGFAVEVAEWAAARFMSARANTRHRGPLARASHRRTGSRGPLPGGDQPARVFSRCRPPSSRAADLR